MKTDRLIELKVSSNCWICEGWNEVRFEWTPGVSSDEDISEEVPLFLHLSIDGFEPDLMFKDWSKPGVFYSTRVLPPGKIEYYYSYDGNKVLDRNKEVLIVPHNHILNNIKIYRKPITNVLI